MPKISPVHYKALFRVFEKEGFVHNRTKGDHAIFVKKGIIRPLVVPMYKEIPVFIIKNLLRTSGLSRDLYFEILNDVK